MVQGRPFREIKNSHRHVANIVLVLHAEVEPLMIAARICVRPHIQMEITHLGLHHCVQIATFEITVKQIRLASQV